MSTTDAHVPPSGWVPAPQPAPEPRRRRFPRRLIVLTGLLLLVVYLLPVIIAHTPLLDFVVHTATADLQGRATVESASLGWFAPVRLQGIEVRDPGGEVVLTAVEVSGDKPLLKMLMDRSDLGEFRVEQPVINVVVRPDGTNVEDLIAKYMEPEEEPDGGGIGVDLNVIAGSVSLTDAVSKQTWQLNDLELALSVQSDVSQPVTLETSATIDGEGVPGRLVAKVSMPLGDGSKPAAEDASSEVPASIEPTPADAPSESPAAAATPKGKADLNIESFPLAMLDSLLARFAPGTKATGDLTSEIHVTWGERTVVQADITARDLTVTSPMLQSDQVRLDRLEAVCEISRRGDRIEIVRSSLDCDAGNLAASGVFNLGGEWIGRLPASALEQTCEIEGRVDLARLAGMLPKTLHIREETRITSGEVQLALVSRPGMPAADSATLPGMVWQGRLEASNIAAIDRGRPIAWKRPVLLTLAAHETPQGPVVDEMKCDSEFLKIHAAGTLAELSAAASFDLKQLADQLGQFVDFGGVELAGNGWANFNWKHADNEQFEADVDLQLRNFRLALAEGQTWAEKELFASLSAAGRTNFGNDTQFDSASLRVKAGEETLAAQLTQPVIDLRRGGSWPVALNTQGELQHWPGRLRSWIDPGNWTLAGRYDLAAEATGSADGLTVRQATMAVEPFRLARASCPAAADSRDAETAGLSLNVIEPKLNVVFAGSWNQKKRKLHLKPASLRGNNLSLATTQLTIALPDEGPFELDGNVTYRGDLQRLMAWFADPKTPPSWRLAGKLDAKATVHQTGGKINGQIDANIANFTAAGASGKTFAEPNIHLVANGGYDTQAGVIRLMQLNATSSMVGAAGTGQIQTAKQTNLQFDGKLQYDLDKLSKLLATRIGPGVHFSGKGSSPASYRGGLSPTAGRATAALQWNAANLYGFPVGPAELKVRMADGVVEAEPLEVTASGGRLYLAPQVQLKEPMLMTLPPGPLVAQVQITPQMCDSLLKYVAPVLADVTQAQGTFSIELEGCRVPLADWTKADVTGRLIVHSVEVGAGPLVKELAVLLGHASPAKLRRESVVPFRMVDGRVYHQGLELEFPDLTIRTSGSVGVDQTLSLMAEMPVPPKWIGNNRLGAALRNQVIRIPMTGTLSSPKLDRRVMEQLSREFLQKAAANVLEDELKNQIDKHIDLDSLQNLFRPR